MKKPLLAAVSIVVVLTVISTAVSLALVGSAQADFTQPGTIGMVTAQRLNLRETPSSVSPVITQVVRGEPVTVTGRTFDGNWLAVTTGTSEGWLRSVHVQLNVDIMTVPVVTP